MRIKRYLLASAPDPQQLQQEVSKLIGEGWQPFGHMVVAQGSSGSPTLFVQAMVQYEGEIRS